MDQKILSELGDYLLAHREEIIAEWLRAVERNADISSPDHHLNYKELVDQLPKLCQELTELLKNPQSNQSRAEVSRAARVHGKYRWRQGYRLEEVIREASVVRRILFHNWWKRSLERSRSSPGKLEKLPKVSFIRPWTMSLPTRPSSLLKNNKKVTAT